MEAYARNPRQRRRGLPAAAGRVPCGGRRAARHRTEAMLQTSRLKCGIHDIMAVCRAGGISSLHGLAVDNAERMVDDNSIVSAALTLLLALELSVPMPLWRPSPLEKAPVRAGEGVRPLRRRRPSAPEKASVRAGDGVRPRWRRRPSALVMASVRAGEGVRPRWRWRPSALEKASVRAGDGVRPRW
eukprot:gene13548-biopygen107